MELEENRQFKSLLAEDRTQDGPQIRCVDLSLVSLIIVGLGLICILVVLQVMLRNQSQGDTTTVDTLNPLNILKTSAPRITPPLEDYFPVATNTSTETPGSGHIAPNDGDKNGSAKSECTGIDCRALASRLRCKLDYSVDPCKDFYKFVCNTFRGEDEFTHVRDPNIPLSNQLSWQKAAAMYQACLLFVLSNVTETKYLVEWMVLLNLDFTNETRLATVNPVEMMIAYSYEQELWLGRDRSVQDYVLLLEKYGVKQPLGNQLASKIKDYEKELNKTAIATHAMNNVPEYIPISMLGRYTTPFVTEESTSILMKLLKNDAVGASGLQYLVAWSFYRQLVVFTEPQSFLSYKTATISCYEHIRIAMNLAVVSRYFMESVTPRVVYQTKRMVSRIRSAYEKALNSSSWVGADVGDRALKRLSNITVLVGSPRRHLDPKFIEEVYRPYPDAPTDRLFPTWIKALSLSTQNVWSDQVVPVYDETDVYGGGYYDLYNFVIIPTALMNQPLLYPYGPLGLNYGGLGMLSLSAQQPTLNHILDSEHLADLVGTVVAYAAYSSLPQKYKDVKLVGLNMSTDRLFFVSHCAKFCAKESVSQIPYAPFRSRCIVPLMNMPEFSSAFGCAEGTPMNPRRKCKFW
ncbi:hypothetical protein MTO96_003879 [Rhipicephalus appendiculatus]